MRMIVPALVFILAASLYFPQLLMSDWVLAPALEAGGHLVLLIAGAWLMVEAAKTNGQKSKFLAQVGASQTENEGLRRESERLKVELTEARTAASEAAQAARQAIAAAGREEAINLLALLQQKGRFLDFVMDDVTKYPDAQIGAAARVVHQGCSAVVREYFEIKPVHDGAEGTALTLAKDYDAHRYRLIGRVKGEPPFRGRVLHRGWLTASVKLPERIDARIGNEVIAPAEVELS